MLCIQLAITIPSTLLECDKGAAGDKVNSMALRKRYDWLSTLPLDLVWNMSAEPLRHVFLLGTKPVWVLSYRLVGTTTRGFPLSCISGRG